MGKQLLTMAKLSNWTRNTSTLTSIGAESYAILGSHSSAARDYGRVIALEPYNAAAYFRRGRAYAEMGQHRKAINDYNRAIALRPGFIEATYYRGRSHWSVGELIQAAKDFVVGFIKDKIPWVEDYVEPQQQPLLLLRSAPRPAAYRHRGIAHIQGPNEQITRSDYSFPLVPNLARTRFNYTNGIAYKELSGIRWFLAKYGAPMVGLSLVFLFLVWLTVKEVRKQAPRRSYKRAKEFSATGTYEFAEEAYTKAIQGEFEV